MSFATFCIECDELVNHCTCDPRGYYDDVRRVQGEPDTYTVEIPAAAIQYATERGSSDEEEPSPGRLSDL